MQWSTQLFVDISFLNTELERIITTRVTMRTMLTMSEECQLTRKSTGPRRVQLLLYLHLLPIVTITMNPIGHFEPANQTAPTMWSVTYSVEPKNPFIPHNGSRGVDQSLVSRPLTQQGTIMHCREKRNNLFCPSSLRGQVQFCK